MARNKDRKLFRRRDLKNWLPREEEPDYEDREDEPEYDERRPAWVSDLFPHARTELGLQLLPSVDGDEGFFIARFRRNGT